MTKHLTRRELLAGALATSAAQAADSIPRIDTHIHLFDTKRPQGVPYPKGDAEPALPARFRPIAARNNVIGAIKVEASPWFDDNQWVLDVIQPEPLIVGMIGNLEPEKPQFRAHLERFARSKLFRGIRYGNLWDRDMARAVANPQFLEGMRAFAAGDFTLDTYIPQLGVYEALVRLTDRVPNLRLVIDHLPSVTLPTAPAERAAYERTLRELRKRNVFVKVSMMAKRVDGRYVVDPAFYRPAFEFIWDIFGEDRLIYGSDWPNSSGNWHTYEENLAIVEPFFASKGRAASEKYFWRNSLAAYKWTPRDDRQRALLKG